MTLLTDKFFDSFASSVKPTEEAETLPPEIYTSQEFYEFEKDALFYREWLCVGRDEWIAEVGDFFTTSHANEPIIISRGRDGDIKAMSAVCQHRAMLVAEGKGNTRGFTCPYHHWSYDLDGKLVGAPAMGRTCNFDKAQYNLPKLKVELWHGFIFVNFDSEAESLASRMGPIEPVVANYEFASLRGPEPLSHEYPWNWKVQFENNNDGYHASRLHQGLHDFVPSSLASFPEVPRETAGYYRLNGSTHPNASFNPTEKALLPVFPKLTEEEQSRLLFVNLPPTLSLVVLNDVVIYLIMDARSPTTHGLTFGSLYHPSAFEDPEFEEKRRINDEHTADIVAQDLHVDLLVQQGLSSRFAPRGRYSWQEDAQRQLNVWLVDRYQQEWDRRRGPSAPVTRLHATS
ncbi:phenylpropionate dioxygenase-like ring-hydroxylating dioxygenase large terminal subunit [Sphingobium sp. B11D3B]|uniref:aromatic ring-hydroxylating oxygenase subunit alpha n=1 Tax=unclassified Sphingobium TaxID=2611147 RepID=UPI002224DC74|nr:MULTISPECIES: aromatic ring-hydroxylating dioxygenase subunit alpha [unclassified Sphingobium]MCW2388615.1 phenylpropionate dioxygenase-like ring-hydroxylating dioxygenase large terminal subunit [Sphingobium sp. B11D3B]MCW2411525.1 phenylpropionate dioxygenase-like ring-hydroxylating dioxygenase large terminal subunit [Sphingobium sp. B8D3D]MCW2416182.1 phenylpropionate dioxygenase-like ring-hydroxylating dioxygenase large terminal subunit [Sphingobium sp. B8D3A]